MRHPSALNFETTVSPADKLDGLTQPSTVIAAMPSTVSTSAASTFWLDALANVNDPFIFPAPWVGLPAGVPLFPYAVESKFAAPVASFKCHTPMKSVSHTPVGFSVESWLLVLP